MIVGVANSGKSTILNLLKNHCNRLAHFNNETKLDVKFVDMTSLNPKAIDI